MQNQRVVVSRTRDPKAFLLPEGLLEKIPDQCLKKTKEEYKSGGLNFYGEQGLELHWSDREDHFLFSISMDDVMRHLPQEVWENFNFPASAENPAGLVFAT
jgi:hypothetical protein